MVIKNLKKEVKIEQDKVVISLEVEVERYRDYTGFDVFPDSMIPDLFLAVSRKLAEKFKRKFKGI